MKEQVQLLHKSLQNLADFGTVKNIYLIHVCIYHGYCKISSKFSLKVGLR